MSTKPTQLKILTGEIADRAKQTRQRLESIIATEGVLQNEIGRQSGVSSGAMSLFLADKYNADPKKIIEKLEKWLSYRDAQKELQSFSLSLHVAELSNTETITSVLLHAQNAAEMVCLYGGAGGGKTHAVLQYAKTYPNVFVVTAEPAMCSLPAVLREIAAAIKISESTCSVMSREITAALVGKKALLIIDEAHHLSQRIFDQLRSIYDKINQQSNDFGLAFLGNEPLLGRLTTGLQMKQIYSRLGVVIEITAPTAIDGEQLLSGLIRGKTSKAGALWAGKIVGGVGGLRALLKAARRAALSAQKPMSDLTETDILSANKQ